MIRYAVPDDSWMTQAACAGLPSTIFYPEEGAGRHTSPAVCVDCPVRQACLDYALAAGERDGVWGGVGPRKRAGMRVRRPRHCNHCDTIFTPDRHGTTYCSTECHDTARARQHAESRVRTSA